MAVLQHLPLFKIKVGAPDAPRSAMSFVPRLLMNDIDEIQVDLSLHLPDMVTIRINDPHLEWTNKEDLFALGKKVAIWAQPEESARHSEKLLLEAEITAIEPDFVAYGSNTLLIRGYARSHRLHFGKHARVFANQTDSDIVRQIAQEVGLEAKVDATEITYEYVLQSNQTNMEFIEARAARIGFQFFVIDETLYFKKGNEPLPLPKPELNLGVELLSFRPRLTLARNAPKIRVHGWDAKGKQPIEGKAETDGGLNRLAANQNGAGQTVKQQLKMQAEAVIVDQPIASVAEANAVAAGLAQDLSNDAIEADGSCRGNVDVRAGCQIKLTGLGKRFSGEYFVTAATHSYSAGGYTVDFTVHGRQPQTFRKLLQSGQKGGSPQQNHLLQGVVVGLVTNLNDVERLGRIKVKYPWLVDNQGTAIESAWAKIASPMAGQNNKGLYYLPEIDDEVLVAFEHGDIHRPYIVGVMWNNKDTPPKPNSEVVKNGKVVQRILRSRLGHEILFDDSDDQPLVSIHTQGEHKIDLTDKPTAAAITVQSKGGHKIILNDAPGQSSIELVDQTGSNRIKIDSMTNQIEIAAAGILRLSAVQIILAAQAGVAMSAGAGGTMQSDGPITLMSSSAVIIQGGVVKIN